jgi:CheY-like chemotaxis protein
MLAHTDSVTQSAGAIVIVDDNADDLFFMRRNLEQLGITAPIVTLHDGHEAIEFLKRVCVDHRTDLYPEIVFLDLNMPRTTGFSVLCWLREQESLKDLKVVILSDSDDPGDVALATALDADAYVAKQPHAEGLTQILRRFAPALLAPQRAHAHSFR